MDVNSVISETHQGANPQVVRDVVEPMDNNELEEQWNNEWTDFGLRDSIVEVMKQRGFRPEELERRETQYGLYPDVSDPNFAARLAKKTEFYDLASKPVSEDSCVQGSGTFDTTSIQRLVARFLHPDTPYNGVLLYHGVGVGKTCSAITVAETYLAAMPYNKVFIIAPKAIAEGFRRTIFDANRLVDSTKEEHALTKELWKSPQCTGMTYLHLTNTTQNPDKDEIAKEVDKLIKQRYKIMGYLAFANWVLNRFKEIPEVITGAAREERKKEKLRELFADHLIIIDEAHNLRDVEPDMAAASTSSEDAADEPDVAKLTELAEGKKLTPVLQEILRIAEGLRLMLMTATPMYNIAPEIVFLLNLLSLNDTKDDSMRLEVGQVFKQDGQFKTGGEDKLTRLIKRYVSYMRGENPNTFPLRLTPPERAGMDFMEVYPTVSISRKEGGDGMVHLTEEDKKIMKTLPLIVHNITDTENGKALRKYLSRHKEPVVEENGNNATSDRGTEVTDFMLDQTMQIGNIFYPNGTFGRNGWASYMKETTVLIRGAKVKQYRWAQAAEEAENMPLSVTDVFRDELSSWAPKIASIVKSITDGEGISFVYSRYVKAGALPIAIALELLGWVRVLADGTPAPLLIHKEPMPKHTKFYVLLTSDPGLSPNFAGLLRYATTIRSLSEANGSKVKAIIGSQIASEGLDLKCIRQIHLLDGWYHLNRIEQIEGRGVRYCSHVDLPLAQRNCLIYLHAVNVSKYETADLYAYRLAVRKAQPIGRVSRLMKINAWDCMLNIDAILLKNMGSRPIVDAHQRKSTVTLQDEPYTSFCDFSEVCTYECSATKSVDEGALGSNISTQEPYDFRRIFLERQKRLIETFKTETALPIAEIQKRFYDKIPDSFAKLGLREILDKVKIHRDDGIYGTLKLVNEYIVFQPKGVTDTQIPIALRYGRAYGRMPKDFDLMRSSLLETAAPQPVKAAATTTEAIVAPTTEDEDSLFLSAIDSLKDWVTIVDQMLGDKLTGPIPKFKENLVGWRWVFRHFRKLRDTKAIAYHWFMENYWTYKQQQLVFTSWLMRGLTTLEGYEKVCADMFTKSNNRIEIFQGAINGCTIYNVDVNKVQNYCRVGDKVSICPSVFDTDIKSIIGKPLDRKADTAPYFGFLAFKQKTVVFKTVDKEKGSINGAECANTSNLSNHEKRIRAIQDILRKGGATTAEILPLLLNDNAEEKPVAKTVYRALEYKSDSDCKEEKKKQILCPYVTIEKAIEIQFDPKRETDKRFTMDTPDPIQHVSSMSLRQVCPYMEFLLRYADKQRVGGVRWFLSVVDSARAGVKMT